MKNKFVSCNAKTPPVDGPRVAFPANDLGSHVGHTSSDTCVHSAFGVVDSNVEISDMRVARGVQKNIVGLQVAVWNSISRTKYKEVRRRTDE